jgi:hypothetical protein
LTGARNLSNLPNMKIYVLAAPFLALAACDSAPPQNNIQEVAANNMVADDVTEVQDDSASAPPAEATAPAELPKSEQDLKDEEAAKKDRGEH